MGGTFNECKNTVAASVELSPSFDFFIHPDISTLFPLQEIELLGFIINSKKMTVGISLLKKWY